MNKEPFTAQELQLIREWFDLIVDIDAAYLDKDDYALAVKVYERLGLIVGNGMRVKAGGGEVSIVRRRAKRRMR